MVFGPKWAFTQECKVLSTSARFTTFKFHGSKETKVRETCKIQLYRHIDHFYIFTCISKTLVLSARLIILSASYLVFQTSVSSFAALAIRILDLFCSWKRLGLR